jgi:hypothetical protein
MTRMNMTIGCALTAWIATAGLSAQTSGTPAPNRRAANATTLTGCIERADQLTTGTEATTAGSQDFMLIRAQASSEKTTVAPRLPGGSLGPMYRLVADAQKLSPHVGHKVEIVGRVEATSGTRAGSSDASPATAARLTVQSIKMLSETCGR